MPFGSMKLFRVGGISLELHPTFYLLPVIIAGQGWMDDGLRGVREGLLALALVYTCVVLHEFGHALTARKLGIPVRHIVLLPFGGMALLERLPRNPVKELLIIVAGPAVNFAIAGGCVIALGGWPTDMPDYIENSLSPSYPLYFLLVSNLSLGFFNLLPAFPMDGGRIVRALLAFKLDYLSATRYTVIIGRFVAVAGIALALLNGSFMLAALFVFILVIGTSEYRYVQREEAEAWHKW